jgi:hypothetical protein
MGCSVDPSDYEPGRNFRAAQVQWYSAQKADRGSNFRARAGSPRGFAIHTNRSVSHKRASGEAEGKETWGAQLADRKNKRAGLWPSEHFSANSSSRHADTPERGTRYGRLEVIAALERHLPQSATSMEEEDVRMSEANSTDAESDGQLPDMFRRRDVRRST